MSLRVLILEDRPDDALLVAEHLRRAGLRRDEGLVDLDMSGEASRANIVRASVELGRSLQLESVAEGVEDARTWDLLARLGCDLAHGYVISRPMGADQVLPWLAKWENPSGSASKAA